MKAKVKDKIKVVNKMNDWSMEYQEGDVFTVESTWYGGVNVTSRTGVPLSLDEVEYEVISEENGGEISDKTRHIIFFADTEKGFLRAREEIRKFLEFYRQKKLSVKTELLLWGEAVSCGTVNRAYEETIRTLDGMGVSVILCEDSLKMLEISLSEILTGAKTCPLGSCFLAERQWDGYAAVKL